MKKIVCITLLFLLVSLLFALVSCDSVRTQDDSENEGAEDNANVGTEGIEYAFNEYTSTYWVVGIADDAAANVVIPNKYMGVSVSHINGGAFKNNEKINYSCFFIISICCRKNFAYTLVIIFTNTFI